MHNDKNKINMTCNQGYSPTSSVTNSLHQAAYGLILSVTKSLADTSRPPRVYISGPIAHYDFDERRAAFSRKAKELTLQGYEPVNPMLNGLSDNDDWRLHMRADMALLASCDMICFLPDWELSKGCKLEFDVATSCGIKILHF